MGPWAHANAQRAAARNLRGQLQAGQLTLEQALGDPAVARLEVWRVIGWMPGWGPKRTTRMLGALRFPISPTRRCGELTERQRRLLDEIT